MIVVGLQHVLGALRCAVAASGLLRATWVVLLASSLVVPSLAKSQATLTDSSGVRIVVNEEAAWGASSGWRLGDAPALEIGEPFGDSATALFRVVGAVRLGNGRVVIADGGSLELRYFAPDGTYLGKAGGKGGGPGEFASMLLASLRGDTIVVYDYEAARLSMFDGDGQYLRSVTYAVFTEGVGIPLLVGMFTDGSALVWSSPVGRPARRPGTSTSELLLFGATADGQSYTALGAEPGTDVQWDVTDRVSTMVPLLFGRSISLAVYQDSYAVARSDQYAIRLYAKDGRLQAVVRKVVEPRTVTAGDIEVLQRARLVDVSEPRRSQRLRMFRAMSIPPTMPAFGRAIRRGGWNPEIRFDDSGNLWVLEYSLPGTDPWHWSVFRNDGQFLGTVAFPAGLEPLHIGDDFVVGRVQDSDGIEYVRVYTLHKKEPLP